MQQEKLRAELQQHYVNAERYRAEYEKYYQETQQLKFQVAELSGKLQTTKKTEQEETEPSAVERILQFPKAGPTLSGSESNLY